MCVDVQPIHAQQQSWESVDGKAPFAVTSFPSAVIAKHIKEQPTAQTKHYHKDLTSTVSMYECDSCPVFKQVPVVLSTLSHREGRGGGETGGCGHAECLTLTC